MNQPIHQMVEYNVPFSKEVQLNFDLDSLDSLDKNDNVANNHNKPPGWRGAQTTETLPGYCNIPLHDHNKLTTFLIKEFCTPDLDRMAPKLWMMATYSSSNINPLHRQKVKGRAIVVTEDPKLHLVWFSDRIFIKPLPKYLLSHAFWTHILLDPHCILGEHRIPLLHSARGFLRSYAHLIKYESDFEIAQQQGARLVPANVTWEQFSSFCARLVDLIDDGSVSPRYEYGELRLSRLNFYSKFLLRRFQYEHLHGQYSSFFSRFYTHLLFIFGVLSIMLNAMQVELAVDQVAPLKWGGLWPLWRYFTIICLLLIAILFILLGCLLFWMIGDEWNFAIRVMRQKRRLKRDAELASSGKGGLHIQ